MMEKLTPQDELIHLKQQQKLMSEEIQKVCICNYSQTSIYFGGSILFKFKKTLIFYHV